MTDEQPKHTKQAAEGAAASSNKSSTSSNRGRRRGKGGRKDAPAGQKDTNDETNENINKNDAQTKAKNRRNKKKPPPTAAAPAASNQQQPQKEAKNPKKKKHHARKSSLQSNISRRSDLVLENNKDYPPHWSYEHCLERYAAQTLIRGKLRVLPAKDAASFVTCDRGLHALDILIPGAMERNRAMDGDVVFVELLEEEEEDEETKERDNDKAEQGIQGLKIQDDDDDEKEAGDIVNETWQDDPLQVDLWNPVVTGITRKKRASQQKQQQQPQPSDQQRQKKQRKGRVVHILPPKAIYSELDPSGPGKIPNRKIVGSIKVLQGGTILLNANNRSLPQFKCPPNTKNLLQTIQEQADEEEDGTPLDQILFQAEYKFGAWKENHKWPPCINVQKMGEACVIEDEIRALLTEYDVDHGDFAERVLKNVDEAVHSGLYMDEQTKEMGWKPTPDMYKGRRDYRSERIFTIDPTTAKDLDDALHIKHLDDGRVEIGVHIADVSFFVTPDSPVDLEAQRRTTTVYLVDRTVPMLPRPLCEVACSLNENVERLAFSCVWRMNLDGTLRTKSGGSKDAKVHDDEVWYGRTVIKSCARLDYSTAQNIIEGKVATGESEAEMDESLWPKSRRPTGGHTIDEVAGDVRLMHRVAMARRKLRFDNGALALNGTKLTFMLDEDGQTPLLAKPYPIRDSNRLVEEYMLLANYLVAQRLITHAANLAVLRMHPEPLEVGLDDVVNIAKAALNFDVDTSSSQALHRSLVQLSHNSDTLLLQCVTNLMMTPMQAAEYFVAGQLPPEEWRHYALNIPYYTHFTSPIRRYPDVLVHRLLQATIDGEQAVKSFSFDERTLASLCAHSNEKRLGSKGAQERCDRIFLSLYVKHHPLESELGIVLSVGKSAFTVFLPSLGTSALLFLQEHTDMLTYAAHQQEDGTKRILLQQKPDQKGTRWNTLEITVFTKLVVTVTCKDRPPIDIKLRLERPWSE